MSRYHVSVESVHVKDREITGEGQKPLLAGTVELLASSPEASVRISFPFQQKANLDAAVREALLGLRRWGEGIGEAAVVAYHEIG